jgi:hypothetical protein
MDQNFGDEFFGDGFARYRSHKVVEAAAIHAAEFQADGSGKVVLLDGTVVEVPPGFKRPNTEPRMNVDGGDVLVRYDDGYLSWSPRDKFCENYTREI